MNEITVTIRNKKKETKKGRGKNVENVGECNVKKVVIGLIELHKIKGGK